MEVLDLIEQEASRRRLSPRTIKTYQTCVLKFLKYINKDPKFVNKKDIKDFMYYLSKKEVSGSTLNVYVNALKFLFEQILSKRLLFGLKFSKTPKTLPTYLTKGETRKLIENIKNPKHRLMIELIYSAGLRISELLNLKTEDLDLNARIGYIRRGKGNKDRVFIIAESLVKNLANYVFLNKINSGLLFLSHNEKPYSPRSLHNIVKKAAKKARINKNVHCHTLRHSFATHLVENGYDVASIQSLLGHNSAKTTMIYVHMASPKLVNIRSPLDDL